ncbi:NHS-like protein 2 [Brachyhypopomus gauderio]|uniref:NHS-like protein 2 n=1 Tax=Brachyhypopomus gauderio TaxID=698409 RepID=UPI0040434998
MEQSALFCPSQTWKGPNVSTFSPEWDDSLNSYLSAPDVIKPPPQFQDPEESHQSPQSGAAVIRRRDKERSGKGTTEKERRSRPSSAAEPHRRSLSLSTALGANPAVARRRCESYALSYPSSSSDDSGSDSTSARRGDRLPDAVPRSRPRSIVLKKAKKKPAPPTRTVSLHRLVSSKPERRTHSLYIPGDDQNVMLLPDLIPIHKAESGDTKQSALPVGAQAKVPVDHPFSSHRPLKELRSSEPCKNTPVSSAGTPVKEAAKVSCSSDCNISPSSSRSSPSQPSISSPSKPPGSASPSSGYSSQCETPTQPVSIITGSSPLGCRMRTKPSNAVAGQRGRNCRSRLSLQLPTAQSTIANPEPSLVQPKVNRRYSDASGPKQRLSNSMLIMPVVTQEDLNNVRLRSVSSTDLDGAAGPISGVIEEEIERDESFETAQLSPKSKPPVAPKPPVSKRLPGTAARSNLGTAPAVDYQELATGGQDCIYSSVNKIKPNVIFPSPSKAGTDHAHQQVQPYADCQSREQKMEGGRPQPSCGTGDSSIQTFRTATHSNPSKPQKKRQAPGPPVAKRPDMVHIPCDNTSALENVDKHDLSAPNYSKPRSSQKEYHVTVYGFIPGYARSGETEQPNIPEYEAYEEDQGPETGPLHYEGEEDEVFLNKNASHTTEDLFTIIHRSKRKLLGRKDSSEGKQGDFGSQTLGGVSKASSQNDNFMALLRRTRSAKAGSGGRISATEMLKSSKPSAPGPADLTNYKNYYMMQSHGP